MIYRQLGRHGLRVSVLGLGTHMNLGDRCDAAASRELVHTALDAGINLFDTANAYQDGDAERMLGACLAGQPRSSFVVLTKAGAAIGPGPNDRGLSAKHLREQCEASLKRLRMDYIDLYLCHAHDPATPVDETLRAMDGLIQQGKVLHWGVSNWPADAIAQVHQAAVSDGLRPPVVNEPRYNLLYREPERALFPITAASGMGNIVYSPLGHGVLAGVYAQGAPPAPGTRAALEGPDSVTKRLYYTEKNLEKAQALGKIAHDLGTTAAILATAWCLTHPAVSCVLTGPWHPEELRTLIPAATLRIPGAVQEHLDTLFPLEG